MTKDKSAYFLIGILMISNFEIFGQELVFKKNMNLTNSSRASAEVLPIIHSDNKSTLIFFDNLGIKAIELNEDFEEIDHYNMIREPSQVKPLLGYNVESNKYNLFFSDNKMSELYTQTIDVSNKQNTNLTSVKMLKKEKYLESASHLDRFYLLTIKNQSSILKLYEFQGANLLHEKEFDFSEFKLSYPDYPSLYFTLNPIVKIDGRAPVPLEMAVAKSKVYFHDSKFYITIDNSLKNTKIIILDLIAYASSVKIIDHEPLECGNVNNPVVANSFLNNSILFQVKSCKEGLTLNIKDIQTTNLLANYSSRKDEEISFKNGPIHQDGPASPYSDKTGKELDETKEALRKISNSLIGISGYKHSAKTILTIGGYIEVTQSSGGIPVGFIGTSASYNPVLYGYGEYKKTRAVYFRSILNDSTFEHVKDGFVRTDFDKIHDFEDSNIAGVSIETIFLRGGEYFFGYYNKSEKLYSIRKFLNDI